jgi:hypothetical protein
MTHHDAANLIDCLLAAEAEDSYPSDAEGAELVSNELRLAFKVGYLQRLLVNTMLESPAAAAYVQGYAAYVEQRAARKAAAKQGAGGA